MADILLDSKVNLAPSPEAPKSTVLMILPTVEVPDLDENLNQRKNVRLAMHTDNIKILLSALAFSPLKSQLKIEGRVIDGGQYSELQRNPIYRFYMEGRMQRARQTNQRDVLVYLLPRSVDINQTNATRLLELPFSPSSLSEEVGFKTAFFDANDLVARMQAEGGVNTLLPQFGGVNELRLGSDTLSEQELEVVAQGIARRFEDEQFAALNQAGISLQNLSIRANSSQYNILTLSEFSKTRDISFSNSIKPLYNNIINISEKIYPKDKELISEKDHFGKRLNDINSMIKIDKDRWYKDKYTK